jgi:hypothetical protein
VSMKNSIETIGNRTCDLPACSAVPPPRASIKLLDGNKRLLGCDTVYLLFQLSPYVNVIIYQTRRRREPHYLQSHPSQRQISLRLLSGAFVSVQLRCIYWVLSCLLGYISWRFGSTAMVSYSRAECTYCP